MPKPSRGGQHHAPAARQHTPEKLAKFLEMLREGNTATFSAKTLGLGRTILYERKQADLDFARAWEDAVEVGIETMEQEAFRRATLGVDKPVYQGGKKVGSVREFSDTLLIFLLKARRPEIYRERLSHEVTGKGGTPLIPVLNVTIGKGSAA